MADSKELNDLEKFLKEGVPEFAKSDEGGGMYYNLDDGQLAVVICYEPGFGEAKRDDCIQFPSEPDYAITIGIRVRDPVDTPDYWLIPYDKDGDVVVDDFSPAPDDRDYRAVAENLLSDYESIKGKVNDDGSVAEEEDESMEKKELREEDKPLQKSEFKDEIGNYFDHTFDFEFLDVVASILDRIDFAEAAEDDIDEAVYQAIDDELIYTADQWTVIEHYCDPQSASYDDAIDELTSDMIGLAEQIAKEKGGEDAKN